jgi:hypothetical protein
MYCLFPRLIGRTKSRLASSLSFLPLGHRIIYSVVDSSQLTTIRYLHFWSLVVMLRSCLKSVSPMLLAFAVQTAVPPPAMLLQAVLTAVALLQRITKVVPAWAGVVLSL